MRARECDLSGGQRANYLMLFSESKALSILFINKIDVYFFNFIYSACLLAHHAGRARLRGRHGEEEVMIFRESGEHVASDYKRFWCDKARD